MIDEAKLTQIRIDDASLLNGNGVIDILELVQTAVKFEYVVLDYLHGGGRSGLNFIFEEKNVIYTRDEVVRNLIPEKWFDFGDFFLFKEYPKNWDWGENELYPFVVKQADTTIRLFDNQYIYVFTHYQEIVDLLVRAYTIESIKTDIPENLDYPE